MKAEGFSVKACSWACVATKMSLGQGAASACLCKKKDLDIGLELLLRPRWVGCEGHEGLGRVDLSPVLSAHPVKLHGNVVEVDCVHVLEDPFIDGVAGRFE